MTKVKLFILIGFLCVFWNWQITAQTKHNIYLNGSAGFSSFLLNASDVTSKGDIGYGFGLGYELNHRAFIMQLGTEFTHLNANLALDPFLLNLNMQDTESDFYVGNYTFSNNFDYYRFANLNIPLMLGARMGRFYFLVGGKFSINLFAKSRTESSVTSTGTYDQFIDDFQNMPNHFFLTRKEIASFELPFDINCYLSGEIGFYLKSSSKSNIKLRLATFVDYGLLDINTNARKENLVLFHSEEGVMYRPYLNNFMLSESMKGSVTKNIYSGLKFTILFGVKGKPICRCDSY